VLRSVRIRPQVVSDLAQITRFIQRNVSPTAAIRWRNRLETAIRALAHDADQWPEADEVIQRGQKLRCRLFGRRQHVYCVLFAIEGQTVNIIRVRHAAQDSLSEEDLEFD